MYLKNFFLLIPKASSQQLPMSKSFSGIILPLVLVGFAKAIIDHSLIQQLTHLKDIAYFTNCENVYVIIDIAICLGYIVGLFKTSFFLYVYIIDLK